MYSLKEYSFNQAAGMLVLGIALTLYGLALTILSLFRGEIFIIGAWRVIVREKIRDIKPLRFRYFGALICTVAFGPGLLILGIISLATFISTFIF